MKVKQNIQKNRLLLTFGALVLLAALFLGIWWRYAEKATAGSKSIVITVTYEDKTQQSYPLKTDAEYLKEAAQTVLTLEGEDTQYGYTVYSINGVKADFNAGNAYWALYVNGEYGNYGIEAQPVTDGDTYAFVYENY